MAPEASASTSTSKPKASVRTSRKSDAGTPTESSPSRAVSHSLVAQGRDFTPEVLEAKRTALLEEKQVTLEQVVDKHDDLVRPFLLKYFALCLQASEACFAGPGVIPYAAVYDDDSI